MDELMAKLLGLLQSQQARDAGFSDVTPVSKLAEIELTYGGIDYCITVDEF